VIGVALAIAIAYKLATAPSDSDNPTSAVSNSTSASSTQSSSASVQTASAVDSALCRKYQLSSIACTGESDLLPWAQGYDFVWRRDFVYEANARLQEYEEALQEFGAAARADLFPLFATAIRNSLARSQEPFGRRASGATASDREQMLSNQVDSFKTVLDALVYFNSALREAGFNSIQTDLETLVRGYTLARIDDVQRLAIDGNIFATRAIPTQSELTYG